MPVETGIQTALAYNQLLMQKEAQATQKMQFKEQLKFQKENAEKTMNLQYLNMIMGMMDGKGGGGSSGSSSYYGSKRSGPVTTVAANAQARVEEKQQAAENAVWETAKNKFDDLQKDPTAMLGMVQEYRKAMSSSVGAEDTLAFSKDQMVYDEMDTMKKAMEKGDENPYDTEYYKAMSGFNQATDDPNKIKSALRTDRLKNFAEVMRENVEKGFVIPNARQAMEVANAKGMVGIAALYPDMKDSVKEMYLNDDEYRQRNQDLYDTYVQSGMIDPEEVDFDTYHEEKTDSDVDYHWSKVPTAKDEGVKNLPKDSTTSKGGGMALRGFDPVTANQQSAGQLNTEVKNVLGNIDDDDVRERVKKIGEDAAGNATYGYVNIGRELRNSGVVSEEDIRKVMPHSPWGTNNALFELATEIGMGKVWSGYNNLPSDVKKQIDDELKIVGLGDLTDEEKKNLTGKEIVDRIQDVVAFKYKANLSTNLPVNQFKSEAIKDARFNTGDYRSIDNLDLTDSMSQKLWITENGVFTDENRPKGMISLDEAAMLDNQHVTVYDINPGSGIGMHIKAALGEDYQPGKEGKWANGRLLVVEGETKDKDGNVVYVKQKMIVPVTDTVAEAYRASDQAGALTQGGSYLHALGSDGDSYNIETISRLGGGSADKEEILSNMLHGSNAVSMTTVTYLKNNDVFYKRGPNGETLLSVPGSNDMASVIVDASDSRTFDKSLEVARTYASQLDNEDQIKVAGFPNEEGMMVYSIQLNNQQPFGYVPNANEDELQSYLNNPEAKGMQNLKWQDADGNTYDTAGAGRKIAGFDNQAPMLSDNYNVRAKLHGVFVDEWKQVDNMLGQMGLTYHINSAHRGDDSTNHSGWAIDVKLSRPGVANYTEAVDDLWDAFNGMLEKGEMSMLDDSDPWKSWRLKGTNLMITPHANDDGSGYHYHIEYDKNMRSHDI